MEFDVLCVFWLTGTKLSYYRRVCLCDFNVLTSDFCKSENMGNELILINLFENLQRRKLSDITITKFLHTFTNWYRHEMKTIDLDRQCNENQHFCIVRVNFHISKKDMNEEVIYSSFKHFRSSFFFRLNLLSKLEELPSENRAFFNISLC